MTNLDRDRFTRDERFDLLIACIREHGSINMVRWQTGVTIFDNFVELYASKNTACIGGHLALLPQFQDTVGCSMNMDDGGLNVLAIDGGKYCLRNTDAVSWWLESDTKVTSGVIFGGLGWYTLSIRHWGEDEAIAALELLRNYNGNITQFEKELRLL